ncbi:hypothetical protein FNF28_07245 [Cafeteria roenbergensis]|uniref:Tyrosine-protein kinase ephrin type A/B receptor-like domain-containing protein n=1 Tax=Cafeteria roenbergensis TaxID=33653 RepID=A0A5A8CD66_CAFRO|nr:hypothetical protein FNF28_07245 [Cafeteria roenbergensis]
MVIAGASEDVYAAQHTTIRFFMPEGLRRGPHRALTVGGQASREAVTFSYDPPVVDGVSRADKDPAASQDRSGCTFEGYTSERCSQCVQGKYYRINGQCEKCPDQPWLIFVLFFLAAAVLSFAAWMLQRAAGDLQPQVVPGHGASRHGRRDAAGVFGASYAYKTFIKRVAAKDRSSHAHALVSVFIVMMYVGT